jgi:hypothetical protein
MLPKYVQFDKTASDLNLNCARVVFAILFFRICGELDTVIPVIEPLPSSGADPDPRSGAFLTPGSGMGKKSRSGSGMNIPHHISERLETIFQIKILNFFDGDPDPGFGNLFDPGYGIWDPGWKKFGSGIRYP